MTFLAGVTVVASFVWMIRRIWKGSALLAIASVAFFPALLIALVVYWNDEESDIKIPFIVFFGSGFLTTYLLNRRQEELQKIIDSMLWVGQFVA